MLLKKTHETESVKQINILLYFMQLITDRIKNKVMNVIIYTHNFYRSYKATSNCEIFDES